MVQRVLRVIESSSDNEEEDVHQEQQENEFKDVHQEQQENEFSSKFENEMEMKLNSSQEKDKMDSWQSQEMAEKDQSTGFASLTAPPQDDDQDAFTAPPQDAASPKPPQDDDDQDASTAPPQDKDQEAKNIAMALFSNDDDHLSDEEQVVLEGSAVPPSNQVDTQMDDLDENEMEKKMRESDSENEGLQKMYDSDGNEFYVETEESKKKKKVSDRVLLTMETQKMIRGFVLHV